MVDFILASSSFLHSSIADSLDSAKKALSKLPWPSVFEKQLGRLIKARNKSTRE
jgi:hypothetical protein